MATSKGPRGLESVPLCRLTSLAPTPPSGRADPWVPGIRPSAVAGASWSELFTFNWAAQGMSFPPQFHCHLSCLCPRHSWKSSPHLPHACGCVSVQQRALSQSVPQAQNTAGASHLCGQRGHARLHPAPSQAAIWILKELAHLATSQGCFLETPR